MCLGIPMQILSINDHLAQCESNGIYRDVNIYLLQHLKPCIGDYVLIHVGYAIQIIEQQDALERISMHSEMLSLKSDI